MYMDYSRLWKLLIDKNITKTELAGLTGISSRVIAKMAKNETVTTDTLARICQALSCRVEDVMECVSEKQLTLYEHFRKNGQVVEENELYKTVSFSVGEQKYTVYITKKAVKKNTHIHCKGDETIYMEQLYPFGGISSPARQEIPLLRVKRRDDIVFVVIRGTPGLITGLDEGCFVSAANGQIKTKKDIFVMSETAFKIFTNRSLEL